ncbi:MAG: NUDIX domain-containing protein [Acidovorax temperans]|uniref:NUDIX domain-containing protein n=1 Tax=Acidovorax temperans TaxID=80878 RepID=UPI003918C78A
MALWRAPDPAGGPPRGQAEPARAARHAARRRAREEAGRSLRHLGAGTAWPRLRGIPRAPPMNVTPTVAHCVWLHAPTRRRSLRFASAWGCFLPWDSPATKP